MKVKDLKVGEIYKLKNKYKSLTHTLTQNIRLHPKVIDIKEIRRLPKSLNYLYVSEGRMSKEKPIMYLGYTYENFHLSGIDWSPIRKRHWCMYQGQKMILDGWAAQHFEKYLGEENE
jgi:hypothetical protein